MARTSPSLVATCVALAFFTQGAALAAGAGGAQTRAWVSSLGTDSPACASAVAPCRTFQYAHDNIVAPGGAIYAHDAAGYGPLVITHAISVINEGEGVASITVAYGDAIDIQAGAGDAVRIVGLTLDGSGTGANGVNLTSAGSLVLTNCKISGFGSASANSGNGGGGILINPASGKLTLTISDTLASNNRARGIWISPSVANFGFGSTAVVTGTLIRDEAVGNGAGVEVSFEGTGHVSILANQVNSSENTLFGFGVFNANSQLLLTRSTATGNGGAGVLIGNGFAFTYGDNALDGNISGAVSGTLSTTLHLQ